MSVSKMTRGTSAAKQFAAIAASVAHTIRNRLVISLFFPITPHRLFGYHEETPDSVSKMPRPGGTVPGKTPKTSA